MSVNVEGIDGEGMRDEVGDKVGDKVAEVVVVGKEEDARRLGMVRLNWQRNRTVAAATVMMVVVMAAALRID